MVLERGSSVHQVLPEQSLVANPEAIVVRLVVKAVEEIGDIVFRGWSGDAEGPAILSVAAIGVHLHTGSAAD
jgi:hypothetical protein